MRKTVPLSSVVPVLRSPASFLPVLSTGKPWLVQTTQEVAPGRDETRFFVISSILTTARLDESCPVTTRRNCSAIVDFLLGRCGHFPSATYKKLGVCRKVRENLSHAAAHPLDHLSRRSHQWIRTHRSARARPP